MSWFGTMQGTNTLKLEVFFLNFQIKENVLRVNKGQITVENTFNLDHLEIKGSHESNKAEKYFFGFFCSFVTSTLPLDLQILIFLSFKNCFVFAFFM